MSTTHNYTDAELAAAIGEVYMRALDAGYTNPIVDWDQEAGTTDVTVDEDGVVKATLLSDVLAATTPSLNVDTPNLVVVGLTPGAITVSDSRGAAAVGKTVKLLLPSGCCTLPVNSSAILDAGGNGVFTFGPPSIASTSGEIQLRFDYDSGEALAAQATVQFSS